jgi:hypothetical protein
VIYVGVDNGANGGIAAVDEAGGLVDVLPMPTIDVGKVKTRRVADLLTIRAWLVGLKGPIRVAVELAQPYPGEGAVQSFAYGRGFGGVLGLLVGLEVPHEVVDPKVWQRAVLAGTEGGDTKTRALLRVQREWPRASWAATPRSRKPHEGMVDAAAIALWCRGQHLGHRVAPVVHDDEARLGRLL